MTDSFAQFKQELAGKVRMAQGIGMGQEAIEHQAEQLGDWLATHTEPRNPEQRLLKELWQVANEDEQHALAGMLVKLVSRQ